METPKIVSIEKQVCTTPTGVPYVQDFATMSDGSRWEVPCIGNGGMWRKVNLSISELQTNFSEYYLALYNQNDGTKEQQQGATGNNPRARKRSE